MNPQIRTLVAIAFVVAGSHAGDEALVVGSRDNCHWFLVRALSVRFFTGGSVPLRIFCSHILSCFLELIHCLVRNSCLPAKTTWRR
ncbi:hypothetical protein GLYMA_14G000201v4 [Glycine max]|nr:hypothetical protein GLYMA_14G000201v4 [Glycine max]